MNSFIILVLVFSALIRSLAITKPLLGNFSSYQTVWAMMARFMEREGFRDLLNVKVNILVNGQPGLHLLSYPLASLVAALLHRLGGGSLDFWGRFQAVLFSVSSIPFFYGLVKRLWGERIARVSTFVYAFSPVNVIYGQSFMNEACAMFFSLASLYGLLIGFDREGGGPFILSGWLMGVAVLARLHLAHLYLPVGYLFFVRFGPRFPLNRKFLIYFLASLILPLAWYGYAHVAASRYDHIYYDLSMQGNFVKRGLTDHFFGSAFYEKFLDIVSRMDFTPIGLSFFILGLFSSRAFPERSFLCLWLASVLIYFVPLSDKVINENFFTLPLVPVGSVFVGMGFEAAREGLARLAPGRAGKAPAAFCGFFTLAFLLFSVRAFIHPLRSNPKEDENLIEVAQEVRQMVPPDKTLIAARGSAPDLLYYCDRNGWPFYLARQKDFRPKYMVTQWGRLSPERRLAIEQARGEARLWLEFLRREGADYFVASNREEFFREKEFSEYLQGHFQQISTKKDFILFDLKHSKSGENLSP